MQVCLCGSQVCRGSFLRFTEDTEHIISNHNECHRLATLLRACHQQRGKKIEKDILNKHALRASAMKDSPEWMKRYASLLLKFIEEERSSGSQAAQKETDFAKYAEQDTCSRYLFESRVQNVAITQDRVKHVLSLFTAQENEVKKLMGQPIGMKDAAAPLVIFSEQDMCDMLWVSTQSVASDLITQVDKYAKQMRCNQSSKVAIKLQEIRDSKPGSSIAECRLGLRLMRSVLPCDIPAHAAARDLITMYVNTSVFFKLHRYELGSENKVPAHALCSN